MSDTENGTGPKTPADLMVTMAELGARAQSALLQAEIEALARIIPGIGTPPAPETDAEVESGFDNMPV